MVRGQGTQSTVTTAEQTRRTDPGVAGSWGKKRTDARSVLFPPPDAWRNGLHSNWKPRRARSVGRALAGDRMVGLVSGMLAEDLPDALRFNTSKLFVAIVHRMGRLGTSTNAEHGEREST